MLNRISYKVVVFDRDKELDNNFINLLKINNKYNYIYLSGFLDHLITENTGDIILWNITSDIYNEISQARYLRNYINTPIIFLTNNLSEKEAVKLYKIDLIDHINKPIELKVLEAKIRMYIKLCSHKRPLFYDNLLTEDSLSQKGLEKSYFPLNSISESQSRYTVTEESKKFFDELLNKILILTNSEYGFIAEVFYNEDNKQPYIKTFSTSDIAWTKQSKDFYNKYAGKTLELSNLNLLSFFLETDKPIICNNPSFECLLEYSSWITSFLGIPIYYDDKLVGVIALYNRNGGYDQDVIKLLEPHINVCTNTIMAYKFALVNSKNERELRLVSSVFENTNEGVAIIDKKGIIRYVNPAFTTITGYTPEEVIDKTHNLLKTDLYDNKFAKRICNFLLTNGYWTGEIISRRKSGEIYSKRVCISSIKNKEENPMQYVVIFSDITEQKKYEDIMIHKAYHDALTGLPNRELLFDRLNMAIAQAQRTKNKLAVMFLDLNGFKNVNDSYGHRVGDQVLSLLAKRLKNFTRKGDTISRIGGDEFIILITLYKGIEVVYTLADKLLKLIKTPIMVGDLVISVGVSIGISIYPDDALSSNQLIKKADKAMYYIKSKDKSGFMLYSKSGNRDSIAISNKR